MNYIHNALSHYWHLRSQDVPPADAASHVKQRFGVEIDTEQPMASTSEFVSPFMVGQFIDGGPICGGPVEITAINGENFTLRWPEEKGGEMDGWDVLRWSAEWHDNPVIVVKPATVGGVDLRFGSRFTDTIIGCTGTPQGS